ncbi:MAG: hypothetical protein ACJAWV_004424 [Flammeovirgaceae bacterium]|jgi:hypothetical protein
MISTKRIQIDLVGFWVSTLCAIHCIAVPLLLTFSAFGSLHFLANPAIESVVIFFSVCIAFSSLVPSYRNKHHKIHPILFMAIGLVGIGFGRIFHDFEAIEIGGTVLGGFFIAYAHLLNWRLLKKA